MKKLVKLISTFLICAGILAGCNMETEDISGRGKVKFVLEDNSRTALPSIIFSNYTYTLTGTGASNVSFPAEGKATYAALTGGYEIPSGEYTFVCKAYSGDSEVLTGTTTATIDGSKTVSFKMLPCASSLKGNAEVTLILPEGDSWSNYTLKAACGSNPEADLSGNPEIVSGTERNAVFTRSDLNADSTQYVFFYIYDKNGSAPQLVGSYVESMIIVGGSTSSSTIRLSAADFNKYAVSVKLMLDEGSGLSEWAGTGKSVYLKNDSVCYELTSNADNGIYTGSVANGDYQIYVGGEEEKYKTDAEISVPSESTATVNYYKGFVQVYFQKTTGGYDDDPSSEDPFYELVGTVVNPNVGPQTGYSIVVTPCTVTTNVSENISTIHYNRKSYHYTVETYYQSVDDDLVYEKVSTSDSASALYQATVTVSPPAVTGMTFKEVVDCTIGTEEASNIVKVYYDRAGITYTIKNYYQPKDGRTDLKVYEYESSKDKTGQAKLGRLTAVEGAVDYGFTVNSVVQCTITSAPENNIVKVYYDRNSYNYTVQTYYQPVDGSTNLNDYVRQTGKDVTKSALFGVDTTESPDDNITGLSLLKTKTEQCRIGTNPATNIVKVYYNRESIPYTVETYFQPVTGGTDISQWEYQSDRDVNSSGLYGSTTNVTASEITGMSNKSVVQCTITANTANNIVKVYYQRNSYHYTVITKTQRENSTEYDETSTDSTKTGLFGSKTNVVPPAIPGLYLIEPEQITITENEDNNIVEVRYTRKATITWVSEKGTGIPTQKQVDNGYRITNSDIPNLTASGFTFVGWYVGETKIDRNYQVTESITLTARWTANISNPVIVNTVEGDVSVSANGTTLTAEPPYIGDWKYQWYFDGKLQSGTDASISVDGLKTGIHTITVVAVENKALRFTATITVTKN